MNPLKSLPEDRHRELAERLAAGADPAPPADLADRLAADVPPHLELAPEIERRAAGSGGRRRPRRWLAAASLLLAFAAGAVALRVLDEPVAERPRPVVQATEAVAPPPAGPDGETRTDPVVAGPAGEAPEEETRAVRPEGAAPAGPSAADEPVGVGAHGRAAPRLRDDVAESRATPPASAPVPSAPPIALVEPPPAPPPPPRRQLMLPPPEAEPGVLPKPRPHENYQVERSNPRIEPMREEAAELERQLEAIVVTSESPLLDASGRRSRTIPIPDPTPDEPGHAAPSTGGTTEPNDQPYGDVFFRTYGTNPFVDTEDDPLSTFALDVDTGSYGVVRRYLDDGHLPPPEAVRVEEMINAFDYGDPAPRRGTFALVAEGAPSPFGEGERYALLRFAVKAREVAAAARPPAHLTFVVDVSGSMAREDRLGLVKQALGLLLDQLRPDDRVALVVYGTEGRILLPHTGDRAAIRRAIDRLRPEGATNAEEGLELAYRLASAVAPAPGIHRVILCSDGVANVGNTGPESILATIGREARRGIALTTVGFGMGNYNDVLMEQLADRGDGQYAYVDDLAEARRVFVEELTGTLQTVAADAKVQVAFEPSTVTRYRLLGYENRAVADERFRDDTVDAGEVGAGHTVTALYEVKLADEAPAGRLATLALRWRDPESGEVHEVERSISGRDLAPSWERASKRLRLASVVAELGEILKGSYWAREGDLDDLAPRVRRLVGEYPDEARVAELAVYVGRAAALFRSKEEREGAE